MYWRLKVSLQQILKICLDELQEHVECIDMANDLHSIGGLVPLLHYLKNTHAGIRAKAAEVVTTIVQNNPKSQQLVMEANGLEPLLTNLASDPDVNVRTKALGAISSLKVALSSDSVRFQRKALNLVQYLLHENNSNCNVITELGFTRIMIHLASSDDAEVREAALRGLLELSSGGLPKDDGKLKQILEERVRGITAMTPEDLGAAREERQLVDAIWKACYDGPSPLQERGLLALPGEDAPPPDVVSHLFESPLRRFKNVQ